MLHHL